MAEQIGVYASQHTAQQVEDAMGAVLSIGPNGNWFIGENDTGVYAGGVKVKGAKVGQTIVVKAVDENNVPTEWEPAVLPTEWEVIADVVTTEEVTSLEINRDADDNPFELAEGEVSISFGGNLSANATWWISSGNMSGSLSLSTHNYNIVVRSNALSRGAMVVVHDTWASTTAYNFHDKKNDSFNKVSLVNYDNVPMPVGTKVLLVGRRKVG